jgi:hypothetical protein
VLSRQHPIKLLQTDNDHSARFVQYGAYRPASSFFVSGFMTKAVLPNALAVSGLNLAGSLDNL